MFNLSGKKVLITGATGGIGEAISAQFHSSGAILVISGTSSEKLDKLRAKLGGSNIHCIPCDLTDKEAVKNLVPSAEDKLEGLDVLICNAGITKDGLAMRMTDEDFESVININLNSSFYLMRACLRGMMKRKAGRIIAITSVVGTMGNPGQVNYVASKAGLTGVVKSLAQEVAGRGITVNSIAPGFIETPMTDKLNEEQKERITKNIPLGRLGTPSDVAAAAIFLASDASSYITGQTIHVNGGMVMV
jgi:3-oxoacyl-[acyl-carrier protein] reductase